MKVIGISKEGEIIATIPRDEAARLFQAIAPLHDLAAFIIESGLNNPLGSVPATAPVAAAPAAAKRQRGKAKPIPAPKPAAAPTPAAAPRSRNKQCATCGTKFHDESRTNTRKFCAPDGCKRDKPAPQDDRPRQSLGNGGARIAPIINP